MDQAGLARTTGTIAAAWACFAVGAALGAIALWGVPRPIVGEGSFSLPAAGVAALVAASAFVTSSLLHRRGETRGMPGWQRAISHVSDLAVTLAFAGIAALGVLAASEVLQDALVGLTVPVLAGAALTGGAGAAVGSLAWTAGIALRTRDLATLLVAFLAVGTLLAMLTTTDGSWWERHFSQLGTGGGEVAWTFNGTLVLAGLLVATIGSYLGRDLHRLLGDESLPRLALVVGAFVADGVALAGVGLAPLDRAPVLHDATAIATLALLVVCAVVTTPLVRGGCVVWLTTAGLGVGLCLAIALWLGGAYNLAGLEVIAVGLEVVWLTTIVRVLASLAPTDTLPSERPSPLRR